MNSNNKLIVTLITIVFIFFCVFFIFVEVYAWNHPEKTNRQITIDLWHGKVFREFF